MPLTRWTKPSHFITETLSSPHEIRAALTQQISITTLTLSTDFYKSPAFQVAMIHKTQGVSFPRSGHAVVWHAIRQYFDKPMCTYGSVLECQDYIWAKQHDHRGEFPKLAWLRHVIQYRNPVRSIVSNYYLHANHTGRDDLRHWHSFVNKQIKSWRRFADKWLLNNGIERSLLIPYESLIKEPLPTLRAIFQFMSDEPIEDDRIHYHNILPQDNLSKFKYFDERVFAHIESELEQEIKALSLPSYRDSV